MKSPFPEAAWRRAILFIDGKVAPEFVDVLIAIGTAECPECTARAMLYRFEDFAGSSRCAACHVRGDDPEPWVDE